MLCDFCDWETLKLLCDLFLSQLARVSLQKYPDDNEFTMDKAFKWKSRIIEAVGLVDHSRMSTGDYKFSVEEVKKQVAKNLESTSKSGTRSKTGVDVGAPAVVQARRNLILNKYFTDPELMEIAKSVIRKFDYAFSYHCSSAQCGSKGNCSFVYLRCAHSGCGTVFSRSKLQQHDDACIHKVIPCNQGCEYALRRMDMEKHCRELCTHRIVPCPHANLGCVFGTFSAGVLSLNLLIFRFIGHTPAPSCSDEI